TLPLPFDPKNTFSTLNGIETGKGLPAVGYLVSTDTTHTSVYVFGNSVSITTSTPIIETAGTPGGATAVYYSPGDSAFYSDNGPYNGSTVQAPGTGTGSITYT